MRNDSLIRNVQGDKWWIATIWYIHMLALMFWFKFHPQKMLSSWVLNVLFRICHDQQTFHNVKNNYKWILLAFLTSPPSSSPGTSKSCSLSSTFLNQLTLAWSAVWLMLDTWNLNRLESKVLILRETRNWGKKSPQIQWQGKWDNDRQRSLS